MSHFRYFECSALCFLSWDHFSSLRSHKLHLKLGKLTFIENWITWNEYLNNLLISLMLFIVGLQLGVRWKSLATYFTDEFFENFNAIWMLLFLMSIPFYFREKGFITGFTFISFQWIVFQVVVFDAMFLKTVLVGKSQMTMRTRNSWYIFLLNLDFRMRILLVPSQMYFTSVAFFTAQFFTLEWSFTGVG